MQNLQRLPPSSGPALAAPQPAAPGPASQPRGNAVAQEQLPPAAEPEAEATGWIKEGMQAAGYVQPDFAGAVPDWEPPGLVPGLEPDLWMQPDYGGIAPDWEAPRLVPLPPARDAASPPAPGGSPASPKARPPRPAQPRPLHGKDPEMKGDPRLLTAGDWDDVRIQRFPTESRIVDAALRYRSTPYVWGKENPKEGLDCSGFSYVAMKAAGVNIPLGWFRDDSFDPRTNPELGEKYGMKHTKSPVPGDVVVFGSVHIGIYVGTLKGEPMYISANGGGRHCTSIANSTGRVDVRRVDSHPVQPAVYYHYTGPDPQQKAPPKPQGAPKPAAPAP